MPDIGHALHLANAVSQDSVNATSGSRDGRLDPLFLPESLRQLGRSTSKPFVHVALTRRSEPFSLKGVSGD
jgi:hypothetical protein